MKDFLRLILIITLISPLSWAHEGHDHDGPPTIQAPKGGIIKSLELTHVEVVSKGNNIKIYLYDKNLKLKDLTGFIVSAKAEFPRTKKQEEINLTLKGTHYEASFDAKGAHRYTLMLGIKDPKTGHNDKLNYVIEPKK